jgi:flagellar biosynthetic protein FliR
VNLEDIVLGYAATWALVASRVAGFVVTSPFPGSNVPTTQRVGLVAVLTWIVTSFASIHSAPQGLGPALVAGAAVELGTGLVMGLAFRFVFMAAEVAGQLLSQAVGLSSVSVLNPTVGAQDAILGKVVTLLALLLALGTGVHRVALGALMASFRALPVGTSTSLPSAALILIDLPIASFAVGVQLAMPVVGMALVIQVTLAMIVRAAPALQIFSVGFSVLVLTGLLVLTASLRDIGGGLVAYMGTLPAALDALLSSLARGAP